MDRKQTINQVMSTHSLPQALAERVVDENGFISEEKLEIAKSGVSWGRNPASSADPRLIQALIDALKEAQARRDMAAVMNLRSRLNKMGVPNPE
jgi:hypothetical protein